MNKLCQSTKIHQIDFKLPSVIHQSNLIEWMQFLDVEIQYNENKIEFFGQCLVKMISVLFDAIKLPIFEESKIDYIHFQQKQNLCTVRINVGFIDNTPLDFYNFTLNYSVKLLYWMCINVLDENNQKLLLKSCINEFVNPIALQMPVGKSTFYILKAAYSHNIPFIHLGNGIYQLGYGSKGRKIDRSSVDKDSAIGAKIANSKILTTQILQEAGLPASKHFLVHSFDQALEATIKLGYPVVIKPSDMERGEGVTINIYTEEKLFQAFEYAMKKTKKNAVLVEKQVAGVCYRVHIVNGQLLFVMKRMPISIQGDGKSSLKQLIVKKNDEVVKDLPWNRGTLYPMDQQSIDEIKKVGYSLNSIPKKDEWVALREFEATRYGARVEDVTEEIHPENIKIAIKAAEILNLVVAGVDIITDDISKPWYDCDTIINEINFAPMFASNQIYQNQMKTFFDIYLNESGIILIDILVGSGNSIHKLAKEKQKENIANGINCYMTSYNYTLDEKEQKLHIQTNTLRKRIEALLIRKKVDAIIVIIENDELFEQSIPLQYYTNLTIVNKNLYSHKTQEKIPLEKVEVFLQRLSR